MGFFTAEAQQELLIIPILNGWLAFSNNFASYYLCPDFGLSFLVVVLTGHLVILPRELIFSRVNPVCQCYDEILGRTHTRAPLQ